MSRTASVLQVGTDVNKKTQRKKTRSQLFNRQVANHGSVATNGNRKPIGSGDQDGERWSPGGRQHAHDRRQGGAVQQPPRGNGQGGAARGDSHADAGPVRVTEILERFDQETLIRFKPGSRTPRTYRWIFTRFAAHAGLEGRSKQALKGKLGRTLLLEYLSTIPVRSRRVHVAALRSVWSATIGPFPIDVKRDLGRLPPVARRKTPPDEAVRPWAEAVAHEHDVYAKAFVLTLLQTGWRPLNQLSRIRWRHVHYENGRPRYVEANGTEAGFKSASPIVCRLPEDVQAAMVDLRAMTKAGEDDPVFPWRSARGEIRAAAMGTEGTTDATWRTFRRKHDLPRLRPVDVRHFVKTALRRLGLSDPALNAWEGHEADAGGMRAVYDNPDVEDLLDEQAAKAPRGPVELVTVPAVRDDAGLPPAAVQIVADVLAGKLSDLEAAMALGRLRVSLAPKPPALEG